MRDAWGRAAGGDGAGGAAAGRDIRGMTPERLLDIAGGWTVARLAENHWSDGWAFLALLVWVSAEGEVTDVGVYRLPPAKPGYRVVASVWPTGDESEPEAWCMSDMSGCEGAGPTDGILVLCPDCPHWESCPRPELVRTRTRSEIENGIRRIAGELEDERAQRTQD